ncbi:MAG: RsmB/NOP family class I SAM-dependent RNA methyltransferase [Pigmentiphaga sp.]
MLGQVLQWKEPADAALSRWLRDHPQLGMRDRGEVAESMYDVLRHLRRYRQAAESGVGAATRRLAVLGLASQVGTEALGAVLDPAEADWLTRMETIDSVSLPFAARHSLPDWLAQALESMPEADALAAALNQQAPFDLRANPFKIERDALLPELADWYGERYPNDPPPQATRWSPGGLRLQRRVALPQWQRFQDGSVEVQDEGSQLLALLVGPRRGEMIIDFCAGAGGKTLLLGALMRSTGRLYAFDVSAARLSRLTPRQARSGLSNIEPVVIAHQSETRGKRQAGKAHRVLVDAPCTGIGTLRRNPDIKWRQDPEGLAQLFELQGRILASAARCVAPGGRLVYATCSLLRAENQDQVEAFLAQRSDFRLVPVAEVLANRSPLQPEGDMLQLRPDVHGTDGFFAAVLERTA